MEIINSGIYKVGDIVDAIGGNIFKNGVVKKIVHKKDKTFYLVLFDDYLLQTRTGTSLEPAKDFKV